MIEPIAPKVPVALKVMQFDFERAYVDQIRNFYNTPVPVMPLLGAFEPSVSGIELSPVYVRFCEKNRQKPRTFGRGRSRAAARRRAKRNVA